MSNLKLKRFLRQFALLQLTFMIGCAVYDEIYLAFACFAFNLICLTYIYLKLSD